MAGNTRILSSTLVAAAVLTFTGCGWTDVMIFPSPSGKNVVRVQQPAAWKELGARIVLAAGASETVVDEFKADAFINFVHCWWAPDESKFAVVVRGTLRWMVAYDVTNRRKLRAEQWQDEIARDIARAYRLGPEYTVPKIMQWAGTSPGLAAFEEQQRRVMR